MGKTKKKQKSNKLNRFVQGQMLSFSFFANHWPIIVLLIIFAFVYISTKYTCQSNAGRIITLNNELENAKTECVKASSDFNSKIRESKMKGMIDTMKLGLTQPEQPPYKL